MRGFNPDNGVVGFDVGNSGLNHIQKTVSLITVIAEVPGRNKSVGTVSEELVICVVSEEYLQLSGCCGVEVRIVLIAF